ncbi:MAG: zinc ABC transporter substrate-binding protein [Opitutales bacterium]|nr:zinc ABC transporter substrate-binding protein [Opitutales bacterium]NRA26265.1 zinc ABC transporter substrate-binding protein [Opitutales bacterium]
MKTLKFLFAAALFFVAGLTAAFADKLTLVSTCGMVTDIVKNVAGDKCEVIGLMGSGVDPHLYKPTRDDVVKMVDADVIFYSGLMLEGRMADTFARMSRRGKQVYAVTELLDESYLMEPEEFEGHWDPHVWNDVSAWKEATRLVGQALGEVDPENAAFYTANAESYIARLVELDAYVKKVIATIPESRRYLITAHDAFGYFARAYGIEVRSVQGISTASAAGVDDINQLVEFIVENDIGAIFVENITSDKGLQAVVEGAGARGHTVVIGGELYSDAMGAPGTYEGTYIGMVDHNATLITRALGGEAPAKGLYGKLTFE